MDQTKQFKKVKKYRVLKVVFYFLGLPLFLFAVFCTAIKFMGQDPFVGTSNISAALGFFTGYERFITAPALYGVWCAFGVWALISIFHIVLSKTVKSRRARMFAVLAFILVIMLGGTFLMDAVFDAKIDKIIENAPEGVVVQDYRSQLSYYSHVSYGRRNGEYVKTLKEQVQTLEKVYNVEWEGADKSGASGNIANKPVTYADIISDPDENGNVEVGVDISFRAKQNGVGYELAVDENGNFIGDGNKNDPKVEGSQLVRVAPNADGELFINGKKYSHYFCVSRTGMNGASTHVWYAKDLQPYQTEFGKSIKHNQIDGVYGKALYNASGLLADGWVFSFDNVLRILEDYYEAQEQLAILQATPNGNYDANVSRILTRAHELRNDYYNGKKPLPSTQTDDNPDGVMVDPWTSALFNQEVQFTENFSLTRGELEYLISQVGLLLGDNSLFDWLFLNSSISDLLEGLTDPDSGIFSGIGEIIEPVLDMLENGTLRLGQFISDAGTMATVIDWVKTLTKRTDDINDVFIVLVYKNTDDENAVVHKDHLYLALYKDNNQKDEDGNWMIDTSDDGVLLDIDFDEGLFAPQPDGEGNYEYNFDLDRLSAFLNDALNAVLDKFGIDISGGIVNTILGLFLQDIDVNGEIYKGLVISGISIPLIDSSGKLHVDVNNILMGLLQNWYSYQSPVIKPEWEFYEEVASNDFQLQIAKYLAQYERALYEATTYGGMIGSTLIGDSLGSGTYGSSFGLGNLVSVRQLITDISYQRVYFPLYSFRDMMLAFSGIVILFYFLSFIAAEKEELYATGKLLGKLTKEDLAKELASAPESPDPENVVFDDKEDDSLSDDELILLEPLEEVDGLPGPNGGPPAVPADGNNSGEVK